MTTRPASPTSSSSDTIMLALLGGAALGAILMALVTPKTGREVRSTLKSAVRRLRGKGDEGADEPIEALFI
jgi:gas vesicle protein